MQRETKRKSEEGGTLASALRSAGEVDLAQNLSLSSVFPKSVRRLASGGASVSRFLAEEIAGSPSCFLMQSQSPERNLGG